MRILGLLSLPLLLQITLDAAQIGQSESAVLQAHGKPNSALSLGNKRILIYPEGKVKLQNGKVIYIEGSLRETTTPPIADQTPTQTTTTPPITAPHSHPPAHLLHVKDNLVNQQHFDIEDPGLADKQFTLFYYAAQWSKPAHNFTPELKYFYQKYRTETNFEIILVSADRNGNALRTYMMQDKIPWPAIRHSRIEASGARDYAGKSLPCLVLFDQSGKILAHSEPDGTYIGPMEVLRELKKRL